MVVVASPRVALISLQPPPHPQDKNVPYVFVRSKQGWLRQKKEEEEEEGGRDRDEMVEKGCRLSDLGPH